MDTRSVTPVNYVPVIRRPEYAVHYELVGPHTFVHVTVDKWSARIKEDYQRDIDQAASLHGGPFYVLCALTDTKLRKFVAMFGFEHAMYLTDRDGVASEILIKRVNNGKLPIRRRDSEV